MAEAEAAHIAQGQRMKEARDAQRALAEEATRREAELARKVAEETRLLHAQLQTQLQHLAAADAAVAQAFADKRAQMARESQTIAQRMQELQNASQLMTVIQPHSAHHDRAAFPPHLAQTLPFTTRIQNNLDVPFTSKW